MIENTTMHAYLPNLHPLRRLLLPGLVALLMAGCAGEMQRRDGMNLILEGQLDQGLAKLKEAVKSDPKNTEINMEYLRQREQGINRLLAQGNSARVQGQLDTAIEHYRHVLAIDPGNAMATNGLQEVEADRRHAKLMAEVRDKMGRGDTAGARDLLRLVLIERPKDVQANQLRYRLEEKSMAENVAGPTLNIKGRRPVTLQFRDANLKMVMEAISRATGVNILLDKDVKGDTKVTIFVKDSPVDETLDLIMLQNQLEKRVLGPNSVLIYAQTPVKQKDYQELKVRRFVLTNGDPKLVQGMLKTILRVKDLHVDDKTNSIIVRDTAPVIRLAEKLIASIDQPEAEVMLEVQLLDLDRKKTLELGIDWPNAVSWIYPVAAGGQPIREIRKMAVGDALVKFSPNLGATLKALETDGDTRVLATPRIRTRSREKARIMIGNRTPIISSAAVPSTAVGSTPVYNTNIQYLDTGIKLEVEPVVYADGEVAIRLALEVSDLGTKYENATTGTLAYATTTNTATTSLRLKDGETQVLAGLLRSATGNSGSNKVPGLGDVPLVGRLFGIQSDKWENREIVLAITPRIVRNAEAGDADLLEMWSGTEAVARYDNFHKGPAKLALPAIPRAAEGGARINAEPAAGAEAADGGAAPSAAGGAVAIKLTGPAQVLVGQTLSVAVAAEPGHRLSALTYALKYDKDKLQPVKVFPGSLISRAGNKGVLHDEIDDGAGLWVVGMQMEGGNLAVGGGTVGIAQFRVIAAGQAAIQTVSLAASGEENKELPVVAPLPLQIEAVDK